MKETFHKPTAEQVALERTEAKLPDTIRTPGNAESLAKARRIPRIAAAAILGFFLILGAYFSANVRRTSASNQEEPGTITVTKKDFVRVVRLTGTTEAVRSRPVLAPRLEGAQLNSMVVTRLALAGSHIKRDDVLVEFDRQAQIKDALDKKAAYQDLVDQVEEKRAAEDAARAKDETELKQAEDDFTKAQLEVTKNDIVSRIDAEKNQEALQEADQTLKQLRQTFQLKRAAAAADIRVLEIQRDRARGTMLYARGNAEKMTIRSPMDGIVVLNTIWLGGRMGEVQEGDEVRPGVPFMKVIDPAEMDVRVEVNQEDTPGLQIGQSATVHLDAYPGLSFPGTLEELAPLGHSGQFTDKVRTFVAVFSIRGSNPKLMPDLSASVDVELGRLRDVLVVPAQSVLNDKGQSYVWLKTATGFDKHNVKIGPASDLEIAIESGLHAGDVIRTNAQGNSDSSGLK
ncbi:MAG TPA: efflux RND transporter periplasmic adaptor subunit [Candidatus Acidoferrales bacterium]|nr:efflux RND transporter periplasmic adaptor subunit [Candidatus Acidoferrales bacterium]